ncbi:MAG TPA: Hpt domain-containing protein [Caulobacteraceae bacterium]|nr:Hpt domain-containing protein [Caulobacteraceae bacterium]
MTVQRPVGALPPETLAAIRIVFFQECEAHLAQLATGLCALQAGDRDPEMINAAYRAAHSIKGGAGIFGLDALVHISGRLEAALGEVRAGRLEPSSDILSLLSRAAQALADLVQAGREERDLADNRTAPLLEELAALTPARAEPTQLEAVLGPLT